MSSYIVTVLFFGTLVASESLEVNPNPCMSSSSQNAYEKFLAHHVRSDSPDDLNQNRWQAFIKQIGTCNRPVQSFIPFAQKQQVDNICSPSGGAIYRQNLCVSGQQFTFTTVRVDSNCIVYNVIQETKYLLLACDQLGNVCRPVHFEPNRDNVGPDNKPACKNPNIQNQAQFVHLNLVLQIFTLLSTALVNFM